MLEKKNYMPIISVRWILCIYIVLSSISIAIGQNIDHYEDGNLHEIDFHSHENLKSNVTLRDGSLLYAAEQESISVTMFPHTAKAGKFGQWKIFIVPQTKAIPPNGRFKIRFIKGFRNLQFQQPNQKAYCKAITNVHEENAAITSSLKAQNAFHGCWDSDAHNWVLTVEVRNDTLQIGDTLTVICGGDLPRNQIYAHSRVFEDKLRTLVDFENNDTYIELADMPSLKVLPDVANNFRMVLNSTAKVNEATLLKLMVLDKHGNSVSGFEGAVNLDWESDVLECPSNVVFEKSDGGVKQIEIILKEEGFHDINGILLNDNEEFVTNSKTNFIRVSSDNNQIYWGEMHNHSGISRDGVGTKTYYFAKYVTGLDFFTATEHSTKTEDVYGINSEEWLQLKNEVISAHEEGKFVALFGFETSYAKPSGHYNMIFNFKDENFDKIPNMPRAFYPDILSVWAAFDTLDSGLDVITIPHHTGKRFSFWLPSNSVNTFGGDYANNKYKTSIEIYSTHGLSESYNPQHNLSYSNNNNKAGSENGPYYAQDAWAIGERLGVTASSDNHVGFPSTNNEGVTAVIANELSRDAVFNAVKTRSTYATTGERMILDFKIDDHQMGEEMEVNYGESVEVNYSVKGTDDLALIEILKWDFVNGSYSGGHPNFEIVESIDLSAQSQDYFEGSLTDTILTDSCLYYMRTKQKALVSDYEAWAWTSPIWIETLGTATHNILNIKNTLSAALIQNHITVGQSLSLSVNLNESDLLNMSVYASDGKLIKSESAYFNVGKNVVALSLPNLSSGQYFISLESKSTNGIITLPFVVN